MMDIGVIFITNLVLEYFLDSRIYELKIFIKFGNILAIISSNTFSMTPSPFRAPNRHKKNT